MNREDAPHSRLEELRLSAFGVPLAIRATQPELLKECLTYLPPGWIHSPSGRRDTRYSLAHRPDPLPGVNAHYALKQNGREIFRSPDRSELLERFGSKVALHIADSCRSRVFVHAGVVAWGGRAVLLPGRSFCGKTTLVAELVRSGATYYSDEYAVLAQDGRVHPYAQPLQIRGDGSRRQTQYAVERLGGSAGSQPLPVGLIVFSKYRAGAHWRPRRLSAGSGLLQMLDNAVSARRAPAMALRTLKNVVASALIVRGRRGDVSRAAQWILERLNSPETGFPR